MGIANFVPIYQKTEAYRNVSNMPKITQLVINGARNQNQVGGIPKILITMLNCLTQENICLKADKFFLLMILQEHASPITKSALTAARTTAVPYTRTALSCSHSIFSYCFASLHPEAPLGSPDFLRSDFSFQRQRENKYAIATPFLNQTKYTGRMSPNIGFQGPR